MTRQGRCQRGARVQTPDPPFAFAHAGARNARTARAAGPRHAPKSKRGWVDVRTTARRSATSRLTSGPVLARSGHAGTRGPSRFGLALVACRGVVARRRRAAAAAGSGAPAPNSIHPCRLGELVHPAPQGARPSREAVVQGSQSSASTRDTRASFGNFSRLLGERLAPPRVSATVRGRNLRQQ